MDDSLSIITSGLHLHQVDLNFTNRTEKELFQVHNNKMSGATPMPECTDKIK
ncbi:MAG: hypothetical protein WAW61_06780 [Methylococcaceae bacterium]